MKKNLKTTTASVENKDITERKRTEEALRESEARLRAILESVQTGILIIDVETHTIVDANPIAVRLFDAARDRIVGSICHRHVCPAEAGKCPITDLGQRVDNSERVLLRADGTHVPIIKTVVPIILGGRKHLLESFVDISDRKRAEAELIETNRRLQEATLRANEMAGRAETANAAKSSFLANMSHEIRTPMNAILGFADILNGQVENPAHKEYLDAIIASGKTLLGLINDILDLSKIEAGKLKLEYSAVNPHTIFRDIQQVFTLETKRKGINFQVEIDPELPAALILDEVRLRQILLNLVGNAVKFTSSGGITLSASKRYRHPDHSALEFVFSVQDTGMGIPSDQQEQIFEVFHQQKRQSHAQYGGTGLGLAICKRLVEAMGGRITVTSMVGQGSTFQVILDNVSVAATPARAETQAVPAVGSACEFAPARILVVDDIKLNRILLQHFLDNPAFTLDEAENGQETLEIIRLHRPDLILLDMRMPVMDGAELMRRLKTDATLATIPVIVVSASAMQEEEAEAKAVGCDGYLRKPIRRDELLQEISRFLKRRDNASAASPPAPKNRDQC